ncbi:unnamed protein product [Ostreobium quekettii]|uniref:MSP domain-containing protein n=1 Tax=Ostreobium quekettii TaxID=121088 RepID=A0A8S1IXQ3_9CHLO|nr:unnamed protein product [Ostreobium quekettii]|eukprot:evm.model.scf_116.8 EVM.evm.TU.scf_116.8   scf_116:73373-74143(-)
MDGVQVYPSELKFPFELGKELTTTMTLHNSGNRRLAFKVLTTNPDKYCVRPCMGVLEPRASLEAVVAMQAYTEVPRDLHDCEDRFLVQSRAATGDEWEVTEKTFPASWSGELRETRLPVWLELPDEDNPSLMSLAMEAAGSANDEIGKMFDEDLDSEDGDDEDGDELVKTGEELKRFFAANEEFASVAKDVLMEHLDKIMKEREALKKQVVVLSPRGGWVASRVLRAGPRRWWELGVGWPAVLAVVGSFLLGRLTA